MTTPLVSVRDLRTWYDTEDGTARAVDGVSFDLFPGRTLAVVGESGCGKSVMARSIMGLVRPPGRIESGEILLNRGGQAIDLAALDPRGTTFRGIRGNDIAMIFQEPMSSLNPLFTIGAQIGEGLRIHQSITRAQARQRSIAMLRAVSIPAPEQRIDSYPHELSGGMRQRAVIAMAMASGPGLLIADEPTTALDVTIQAQVLDLMRRLQKESGAAILFITHDMGVVAQIAHDVMVMYRGRVVESGEVREILRKPRHPYTQGLMASVPSLSASTGHRLPTIAGNVPSATEPRVGCGFAPRCPRVFDRCVTVEPELRRIGSARRSACHLEDERGRSTP